MPKLSICVPTYNRSSYLRECLVSILTSVKGYEDKIEIVISDNASTDNTKSVVSEFQNEHRFIRYHRNDVNTGDLNFYIVAGLARGEYIWVFADDDKMEAEAISIIFDSIDSGYNLIISNYSIWTSDFHAVITQRLLPFSNDVIFDDCNLLLRYLGPRLNFLSCVIIKKDIFFTVPTTEFEPYLEYGHSFLYSVYTAVFRQCYAHLIAKPLVAQRKGNSRSDINWWYKCFVTGSSLVFRELNKKGYSNRAVYCAKHQVLKDYVMHDISLRKRMGESLRGVFSIMIPYYKRHWFFWFVCVPMIFAPRPFIWFVRKIYLQFVRKH